MDMSYFNYCAGLTMTSEKFHRLFGGPPRKPDSLLTQRDMDIAASIQRVTEEIMLRAARHVHSETGMNRLCLAGGVALNCVGNGRILREGPFEEIWIQPAADDAGGALGVALFIWYQLLGNPRRVRAADSQHGSLLGPAFSDAEIGAFLSGANATYTRIHDDDTLCDEVANLIARGKVIGWFQGRMEFGPRALGSRSILGDPRNPSMQAQMNLKVKFRESFRPFAPAVLKEHAGSYFETRPGLDSPYMLLVAPVSAARRLKLAPGDEQVTGIDRLKVWRSEVPAITHVDFSARMQTVDRERHGLYHKLLQTFHRKTGCPVLINTSFNLGWDPIVCTPHDAYETFMASDIDVLCMGRYLVSKHAQKTWVPSGVTANVDAKIEPMLASPCCRAALRVLESELRCTECARAFQIVDGIPLLFWPHEKFGAPEDVTRQVEAFYSDAPFPNYDEHDSLRSLIEKSRRGRYAALLDKAIPYNSAVLEVGCGTGQLSNFLGISCRTVVGTDLCLNSLRLGDGFRRQHGLSRVRFLQMNLFRPCLKPEQFDVVVCNGVLHHTSDPFGGFQSIERLVRPGGYIVVGLYNRFGRIMTDLRRTVFRFTGERTAWLDPYLRSASLSQQKHRAWFQDQYRHPHESKHTVGEVLDWFDRAGLTFVRGVPAVTVNASPLEDGQLFEEMPRGGAFDHFVTQAKQIVTGNREGGFFILIGRKPGTQAVETAEPKQRFVAYGAH